MKPSFTTKIEHTINFYSLPNLSAMGFYGLKDVFISAFYKEFYEEDVSGRDRAFAVLDSHPKMRLSFANVSQELMDGSDLKLLGSSLDSPNFSGMDVRLVLQYLVNKEVLPPGNFVVTFIE